MPPLAALVHVQDPELPLAFKAGAAGSLELPGSQFEFTTFIER